MLKKKGRTMLRTLGTVFQVLAVLVVLGGVFYALVVPVQMDAYNRTMAEINGTTYVSVNTSGLTATAIISSLLAALFLLAFGAICKAIAQTAENSERTAAALEALAARRRQ